MFTTEDWRIDRIDGIDYEVVGPPSGIVSRESILELVKWLDLDNRDEHLEMLNELGDKIFDSIKNPKTEMSMEMELPDPTTHEEEND